MPLRTAEKRCPVAVFLAVDHQVYEAASAVVMDTLRAYPGAVVEVLGWDEAKVRAKIATGLRKPSRTSASPARTGMR